MNWIPVGTYAGLCAVYALYFADDVFVFILTAIVGLLGSVVDDDDVDGPGAPV